MQAPPVQASTQGRTWWRSVPWRSALDTIATVVMIAAALTLIWVNRYPRASSGRAAARTIPLPDEPVALEDTFTKGNAAAPIALIEYSDFQCPFCGRFSRETLPRIEAQYVRSGRLLVAFRHYPLEPMHPLAFKAAESAECAGRQAKFWEMHDQLFASPTHLEEPALIAKAEALGLDAARFTQCLGGETRRKVRRDADSAQTLHLAGTPVFLIGRLQADRRVKVVKILSGALPLSAFQEALDDLLKQGEG